MMTRILLLLFLLLPTACADVVAPRDRIVAARFNAQGMVVTNLTPAPIFYFTAERDILALLNWAPCADAQKCAKISPRETVLIPYSELFGWRTNATAAVFYWWYLVPTIEGELVPDEIRANVVTR
jgi:hypothetical protein